jgi:hypothetical protein
MQSNWLLFSSAQIICVIRVPEIPDGNGYVLLPSCWPGPRGHTTEVHRSATLGVRGRKL